MLLILCKDSKALKAHILVDVGFFIFQNLATECLMSELSNAEVYNRWKNSNKKTARDYWYEFLKARADRNIAGAQEYVDKIEACKL